MSFIDDIKSVGSVLQKAGNIDIYQKLINIQTEIISLQQENNELKKELNDLKALNEFRENSFVKNDMYYILKNNRREGPYCTACLDSKEKLIRLHSYGNAIKCPVCSAITYDNKDKNKPATEQTIVNVYGY
jgi:reverse gyrase